MKTTKPIFLALKSAHYERFKSGGKDTEYRLYGPRWNEGVCAVGRAVTLSKGYGKHDRLSGTVVGFDRKQVGELNDRDRSDVRAIFGDNLGDIACIRIDIEA